MFRCVVIGVSLAVALVVPAAATGATTGSGMYVTFAARVCPDYADITANKARNDIQESLRDLGPDTPYSGGDTVNAILTKAEKANCAIIVPVDAVVAWHLKPNAPHQNYGLDAMDPTGMILDIGRQSRERIKGAIDEAATLIWNGPLGAFETPPFDAGTMEIAKYVAARTKAGKLVSVAGGGDTVSALAQAGVKDQFTYVSTAGGAFLEWMEGKALPGVAALMK